MHYRFVCICIKDAQLEKIIHFYLLTTNVISVWGRSREIRSCGQTQQDGIQHYYTLVTIFKFTLHNVRLETRRNNQKGPPDHVCIDPQLKKRR